MTAYLTWILAGIGAGIAVFLANSRKLPMKLRAATVLAVPAAGIIGARLFYVLVRLPFFIEIGGMNWLWPEEMYADWGSAQGFALWGAVGGGALAAAAAARLMKVRPGSVLDALAPAAAVAIALCRFGEYRIGEGLGEILEEEAWCFFPIAVMNEWEEWKLAVFFWEGAAAAVIFAVLIAGRRRTGRPGDRARRMLILYSAAQILLEALRRDSFLRWMFVRVSQVTAAVVLAGLMAEAIVRQIKEHTLDVRRTAVRCGALLLCTGCCVALEFAADKSANMPVWLCYLLEGCCCTVMGIAAWRTVFAVPPGKTDTGLR